MRLIRTAFLLGLLLVVSCAGEAPPTAADLLASCEYRADVVVSAVTEVARLVQEVVDHPSEGRNTLQLRGTNFQQAHLIPRFDALRDNLYDSSSYEGLDERLLHCGDRRVASDLGGSPDLRGVVAKWQEFDNALKNGAWGFFNVFDRLADMRLYLEIRQLAASDQFSILHEGQCRRDDLDYDAARHCAYGYKEDAGRAMDDVTPTLARIENALDELRIALASNSN